MKDYFYSNLNLNNMLNHIDDIQNLEGEKIGNYGTQQKGSYRIYIQEENMYIKSMIEVSEDVWEKLEIFIKDNIDKFYIIDDNTDLSVKNLRSVLKGNNYINIYAA